MLQKSLVLTLLFLGGGVLAGRGQYVGPWQTEAVSEPSRWVPQLKYVKTDVEAEQDRFQSSVGAAPLKTERLYVAPALGIGWNNYIYHPYLLTYSLLFEPGYILEHSGLTGAMHESDELTLNGNLVANVLPVKPYATTLSYNRSHNEVKYDFFTSALVDAQGWGVATGYREGPVPVTLSFDQTHEDSTGFNLRQITDQTTVNLHARNERQKQAATDLTYQYGEFDRETETSTASLPSENSYNRVSLTDTEHFRKSTLRSAVLFYDQESPTTSSSDLNATVSYNLHHTPTLRSFDTYSFSRFSGNLSDSIQNYASAGLQHLLYESLTSTLELHGSSLDSSSAGSTLDARSVGTSASVDYSKRLGHWGRLILNNNASYTYNQQETSGSVSLVPNESHALAAGQWVRLDQPRVIAIVSVTTDAAHGEQPLTENMDYFVDRTQDPWLIQRDPASLILSDSNNVVLVNYTVQPNPSGNYSVFGNQAQVSLRFWQERANVFARYRFTDNAAISPEFVLQDEEEFQTGAELNWLGLALHGDYTDYRSTLYDYKAYNLSESYSMNVLSHSTVGVDLNQQWTAYASGFGATPSPAQNASFFNYLLRYEWHPFTRFNWRAEAGYRQQRGLGLDQDLFTARTYLNWTLGKLEVHLGYEHDNQDLQRETRKRDFAFLRVKRSF